MMIGGNQKEQVIEEYDQLFPQLPGVSFYNHGYLPLLIEDTGYGELFSENLYHYAVNSIESKNKTILEVGCGRGGGLKSLSNHLEFENLIGCDINALNIKYCEDTNDSIKFDVADAEKLPYKDNSVDVVLNIESSHCYPNLNIFFQEVDRVLNQNGTFVWCDCFESIEEFNFKLDKIKNNKNFDIQIVDDITNNVIDSLTQYLVKANTLSGEEGSEYSVEVVRMGMEICRNALVAYKHRGGKYYNVVINKKVVS